MTTETIPPSPTAPQAPLRRIEVPRIVKLALDKEGWHVGVRWFDLDALAPWPQPCGDKTYTFHRNTTLETMIRRITLAGPHIVDFDEVMA